LALNLKTTNSDAVHNQNEFQRLQTYQNLVNLNDCTLFAAQSTLSVLSPLNDCYSLGYNNQHTITISVGLTWPVVTAILWNVHVVSVLCERRILNWLRSTMSQPPSLVIGRPEYGVRPHCQGQHLQIFATMLH